MSYQGLTFDRFCDFLLGATCGVAVNAFEDTGNSETTAWNFVGLVLRAEQGHEDLTRCFEFWKEYGSVLM